MKLYTYFRSSASYRVRIALAYKGIVYESIPVDLLREQARDGYEAVNALRQVPVLEWDEGGLVRRLTQSLAIVHWLEATVPTPALLPSDPLARARAWELAEIVNAGIQPHQNTGTAARIRAMGGDAAAYARTAIEHGLVAMERIARETAGRFLVGDAVSVADVCLVPQLYAARRLSVALEPFPTLLAVEARANALAAFAAAHPDRQPDASA